VPGHGDLYIHSGAAARNRSIYVKASLERLSRADSISSMLPSKHSVETAARAVICDPVANAERIIGRPVEEFGPQWSVT
jgi:hypothetical protein